MLHYLCITKQHTQTMPTITITLETGRETKLGDDTADFVVTYSPNDLNYLELDQVIHNGYDVTNFFVSLSDHKKDRIYERLFEGIYNHEIGKVEHWADMMGDEMRLNDF